MSGNRNNGGGVMDYENDAFPLLSKDNSALEPMPMHSVPRRIDQEGKSESMKSDKSKKSAFSLGFSRMP